METEKKHHWENIFQNKTPEEVSWTETFPKVSINMIQALNLDKTAPIIDVGGGDSLLADALLELGYSDISVLDISGKALERAKKRIGSRASEIQWIESDIIKFKPLKKYSLWHDRASFHFLIDQKDIKIYTDLLEKAEVKFLVIGTFSVNGPEKCSGLPVTQYDCISLENCFSKTFTSLECLELDHTTPFNTQQEFIFSRLERIF